MKYAVWALQVVVLLVGTVYVLAFVRVVPPISATVVDAVSAQPVPRMNVLLQVGFHVWEMQVVSRREDLNTGSSGRFFF